MTSRSCVPARAGAVDRHLWVSHILAAAFLAMGVTVPWLLHRVHLGGASFLPMHFFVITAGLVLGWRHGLTVGLLLPVVSYSLSEMPGLPLLPQMIGELGVTGLAAGLLHGGLRLPVAWSVPGAIAAGRVALLISMWVVYLVAGQSYSPAGLASGPLQAFWATLRLSWPGLALQLLLLPAAFEVWSRLARKNVAQ